MYGAIEMPTLLKSEAPMRTAQPLLWACIVCCGAHCQDIAPDSATKKVTIQSVRVKGSRFSAPTLAHLTGLAAGQIVDEAKVREAIGNAMASGLFTNIAYDYESQPDSTDVVVELTVTDQLPLLPVTITVPGVNAEAIWKYLTDFDPLFAREMPPTVKAIQLYARYINKYLDGIGRTDIRASGNVTGTDTPTGVVFEGVKLRSIKR